MQNNVDALPNGGELKRVQIQRFPLPNRGRGMVSNQRVHTSIFAMRCGRGSPQEPSKILSTKSPGQRSPYPWANLNARDSVRCFGEANVIFSHHVVT